MSAWGHSFGATWGNAWGDFSAIVLRPPLTLELSSGVTYLELETGATTLELDTGETYLELTRQ